MGTCDKTPMLTTRWQLELESDCCQGGLIMPGVPRNAGIALVWVLILFCARRAVVAAARTAAQLAVTAAAQRARTTRAL